MSGVHIRKVLQYIIRYSTTPSTHPSVHATPHRQISRRTGFSFWDSASIPPTLLALLGRPCFWQNILTLCTFTGMRVHAQSVYTIIRTILQPKLPKYLLITLVTLPVQEKREKTWNKTKRQWENPGKRPSSTRNISPFPFYPPRTGSTHSHAASSRPAVTNRAHVSGPQAPRANHPLISDR